MPARSQFVRFVTEQMADFGLVEARAMFGGAGLFRDGLMFALIAGQDMLFLKVDEHTAERFEAECLPPFTYRSKTGTRTLASYRRAPERCLDDIDEMSEWASLAWSAALRSSAKSRP